MKFKNLKKEFFATERGQELKKRFNRIYLYSFLLIIFGIWFLIDNITKTASISGYIYSILLLLFGIGFLIGRYMVLKKQVITYGIKKKEQEKKSKKK